MFGYACSVMWHSKAFAISSDIQNLRWDFAHIHGCSRGKHRFSRAADSECSGTFGLDGEGPHAPSTSKL